MARLFGQALVIRTFVKAVAYFLAGRAAERLGNKVVLLAIALAGSVAPLASLVLPLLGAQVERSRAAFDLVVLLSLSLAAFLVTRLPRDANLN